MKKLLLSLLALAGLSLTANAADDLAYQIVFGCEKINTTNAITSTTQKTDYITSGADYIKTVVETTRVYKEGDEYVKFGASSNTGSYVFEPSQIVNATKIVIKAASYGSDSNPGFKVNEKDITIESKEAEDYTVQLTGSPLSEISLSTTTSKSGRVNLYSISVYVAGTSTEPEIVVNQTLNYYVLLNQTSTLTLNPEIYNIDGTINITYSNNQFSGPTSISASDINNGIPVTFTGSQGGTANGTITLTAGTASASANVIGFSASNEGTQEDPLSVEDVVNLNNKVSGTYYVQGIINSKTADSVNGQFQLKEPENSNIVLSDSQEKYYVPVQLPTGQVRDLLNIVDNPGMVGETVTVYGSLEAYFSVPGVKNTVYVSNQEEELNEYSVAEALAFLQGGGKGNAIVSGYVIASPAPKLYNGKITYYIADSADATSADALQIYNGLGIDGETFQSESEVLAGAKVQVQGYLTTYTKEGSEPQYEMTDGVLLSYDLTGVDVPEIPSAPQGVLTVADAVNNYILKGYNGTAQVKGYITAIEEIDLSYGNATYTIADSDDSTVSLVVFRGKALNGEKFASEDEIEVGGIVTIEGTLVNYQGTTPEITNSKIISYIDSDGVEGLINEANGPVEYYNLQGVRVNNPVKGGLYIIRQGKKSTKAVIR